MAAVFSGTFGIPEILMIFAVGALAAFWVVAIVESAKNDQIGWLLVAIIFPLVGTLAYLILGRPKEPKAPS